MFLAVISRSDISQLPVFFNVRTARAGDYSAQLAWEGTDWSWEYSPQGWTLRQELCEPSGIIRAQLAFNEHNQTLTVSVSAVAGTTVYYHKTPTGDIFLSSSVQLLRKAGIQIEEDEKHLPEFFAYRCLLAPATLFRNIGRIPFGGQLIGTLGTGRLELAVTTIADKLDSHAGNLQNPADHINRLVESLHGVIRPLASVSDRVAMLLSGGIDSSVICQLATSDLGLRRTIATSYPFEAPAVEVERRYALTAAEAMKFQHEDYRATTTDYMTGLVETIALTETPVHHLQSVCLHLLQKSGLRSNEQIVLQGLGAGSVTGNFRNFLYLLDKPWSKLAAATPFYQLLQLAPPLTGRGKALFSRLTDLRNRLPLEDPGNPIWAWHWHGDTHWICSRFNVTPADIIARHVNCVQRLRADTIYDTWARYALVGDEEATLAIFSMLSSTNGRTGVFPYYDETFLNNADSIPWSTRMAPPENSLRKAVARAVGVPDFILNRRKAGFGIHRDDWALEGGVFDPIARLIADVVGRDELRVVRSRDRSKAMIFWNLLNYALWKRICVNGESAANLIGQLTHE